MEQHNMKKIILIFSKALLSKARKTTNKRTKTTSLRFYQKRAKQLFFSMTALLSKARKTIIFLNDSAFIKSAQNNYFFK